MRVLVKLLGWLVIFGTGLIVGFMISPVKQGCGNTVNHNYNRAQPESEENNNEY